MSTIALAPHAVRRPAARSQVRLTRRGRIVVFLLALAFVLAAGIALGAGSVASREGGTPPPTEVVLVGEGETLWQIAAERADDGDVRAMIDEIKGLNALESSMLYAGQRLHVPVD